ncbi:MAG: cofactor-independent phosphoglycerate mutase [Candidatus Lambdaproteobacteria bacterium]|nr:cofactor-independent phosphoglycerate mutase [Candidatus Lambdaproteobacteria bacterium]
MKYLILQGDGMGDMRGDDGQPTPLETAHTPHFDRIAGSGEFGLIHTIPQGYPPGSDVGNLSLFGYDPHHYYTGRSPLEAAAMGVELGPDDIAFRLNLVTLSGRNGQEVMDDYSSGHIDSESAARIVATINDELSDGTFQFYPGVSYRHLLVWRQGLERMTTTPPHDITGRPIADYLPQGPGAEELRRIMTASRGLLAGHPVNKARVAAGQRPVSLAWLWGQGRKPAMDTFESRYHLRGACISAVDLVRGVAVNAGFEIIHVPGATGFLDTDYAAKGRYALKSLGSVDVMFLHVEAPDEAGHMGDRAAKVQAIEAIDEKILGPLLKQLPLMGPFKIMLVSDHATPVALRTHTPNPVPYAMATGERLAAGCASVKYGETEAARSGHVIRNGHEVIRRLIDFI